LNKGCNKEGRGMKNTYIGTSKSTSEIRSLLRSANLDFDSVVNAALNHYLPRIFLSCPFSNEICIGKKQCVNCDFGLKKEQQLRNK
jgi:hypothetical protein